MGSKVRLFSSLVFTIFLLFFKFITYSGTSSAQIIAL